MTQVDVRDIQVADVLTSRRGRSARRGALVTVALLAGLVLLALPALALGRVQLTPIEVVASLLGRGDAGGASFIVTGLRLPRLALAVVVGAALGMAGAILQAVVRNPLASPDVVGITGGASAAAVLAIAAGSVGAAVSASALVGALLAAVLVFALSGRGLIGARFVVVGIAIAFLASGVLGFALTRASLTGARSAFFWLVGSVGSASWPDVALLASVIALAAVAVVAWRRPVAALAFDDDTARSIGVDPVATRVGAIAVSSILAGVAVSAAGPVAFVAFAAGPIARRLRGRGPAVGTAALVGAVVLVGSDLIAQHLIPGATQPPVGLVTAVLGAPAIIWILVRDGRRREPAG